MNLSATGRHNLSQWLSRNKLEDWRSVNASEVCAIAFDFEFTRLPLPLESSAQWISRVEILSIGMAPAPDYPTCYAAAKVTPALIKLSGVWTRENVIPLIEQRPLDDRWESDAGFYSIVSRYWADLEERSGKPLVLVSDWQGDALLLIQQMGRLTPRIAIGEVVGPKAHAPALRDGLIHHNALDDAIWLRRTLGLELAIA